MGEGELEDRAKVIFAELEKKKKRERKEVRNDPALAVSFG